MPGGANMQAGGGQSSRGKSMGGRRHLDGVSGRGRGSDSRSRGTTVAGPGT